MTHAQLGLGSSRPSIQANLPFSTVKGDSQSLFSRMMSVCRFALAYPGELFSLRSHRYTLNRSQQSFCASAFALLILPNLRGVSARPTFLTGLGGILDAGSSQAHPLAVTENGDIFIGGSTASDALVTKWTRDGSLDWAYEWGSAYGDSVRALTLTEDGGFATGGYLGGNSLIAKWWINGTLAWAAAYGESQGDGSWGITTTSDGGIVAAGSRGSVALLLTKFWGNGTFAWARVIEGTSQDWAWSLTTATDGDIVVGAFTASPEFGAAGADALLTKWSIDGALRWAKMLGGTSTDFIQGVAATPDGGIVGGGWTDSIGAGSKDALLAKWWNNGTLAWAKVLGGAQSDQGMAVTVTSAGRIVLVGYTNSSGAGGDDALITQWGAGGNLEWAKTLGGANQDRALGIKIAPDRSIIITGYSNVLENVEMLLAKLNPAGEMFSCSGLQNFSPTVTDVTGSLTVTSPSITPQNWSPTIQAWNNVTVVPFNHVPVEQCVSEPSPVITQPTFLQTMGGAEDERARALVIDEDGNMLVVGFTGSFGQGGAFLTKWEASGELVWADTIGGASNDIAQAITIMSDGAFLVSGWTDSFGQGNFETLYAKWAPNGTFIWAKTLGGFANEEILAVAPIPAGGIMAVGYTNSFGSGSYDVMLATLSSNGSLGWVQTWGGTNTDVAHAVVMTSDDGIMIAGYTSSFGVSNTDALLAKWWNNGTFAWARTIGGTSDDRSYALVATTDAAVIQAGYIDSFGQGSSDALLAKWWLNGTLIWAKAVGGVQGETTIGLTITPDEGIVAAGATYNFGGGDYNGLLMKFWNNGTLVWARALGGVDLDEIDAVAATPEGEIVAVSYTTSFGVGKADALLAKLTGDNGQIVDCSMLQNVVPAVLDITGLVSVTSPSTPGQNWSSVTFSDWNNVNVTRVTPTVEAQCHIPLPSTTGVVTTGVATTGVVTTGPATTGDVTGTTGSPTTGIATTGQGTTGIATTGTTPSSSTAPSETKTQDSSKASQSSDSTSLIVGLATTAGVLTFLCGAAFIGLYFVRRRQKSGDNQIQTELSTQPAASNDYANFEGSPAASQAATHSYQNTGSSSPPAYTNFENKSRVPEGVYQNRSPDLQNSGQNPYGMAIPVAGQQKQAEAPIYIQAPQQMGQGTKLEGSGEASMSSGYVPAPPDVYAFTN